MASLNTLRTKFGIVLSIVIAGALLAFILSLKTEMGFSGNDPRVGVINGKKSTIRSTTTSTSRSRRRAAPRKATNSSPPCSPMLHGRP